METALIEDLVALCLAPVQTPCFNGKGECS